MKKTLLAFSAFIFSIAGANAQITITTADIASPIKVIYQANDSLPTISVGSAGASQTWNMAALNMHTTDTMNFVPYSFAPNPKFSTASMAMKQGYQNNYAYLINNSSGLSILGNSGLVDFGSGPTQVDQVNTPAEKLMTFPATYNTTFTNDYTSRAKFYYGMDPGIGITVDSVRQTSAVHKVVLVDAWGSLTTPLGTYSVIRDLEYKVTHDTVDAYISALGGWQNAVQTTNDSVAQYTWWANGVGFPLVSVTMDVSGNVASAQWLEALPAAGINEYAAEVDMNVYPNPAQNEIHFASDASKITAVQIFDITGRMIDAIEVGGDVTTVNTSKYANGAYTYSVIGKNNSVISRGKFNVTK